MSEQFNFGANAEKAEDELRVPQLDVPFLGNAYLKDVRIDNELGSDNYRVLITEFICVPPNQANFDMQSAKEYREVYWEPDQEDTIPDGDGPSRIQKMLDRLAYRLKYWFEDDEDKSREQKAADVVQMSGDSLAEAWDNLRERIVEAMAPKVPEEPIQNPMKQDKYKIVQVMILGNVYWSNAQGQQVADLSMPAYKGTIADDNSEYPLSLSPQQTNENREWSEFHNSTPSGTDEVTEDEDYEF